MSARIFCYTKSESLVDLTLFQRDPDGIEYQVPHGRLEEVAQDIAIAKADAVCHLLLLLAAARVRLRSTWTESSITPGKARLQKTTATSLSFQQEAAHLLPGNILINGDHTWDVVGKLDKQTDTVRLAVELMMAFADTCSLPACFNKADSQAENGKDGLKAEFAATVALMGRHLGWKPAGTHHLHSAIGIGLERWFLRSHAIYTDAARIKHERAKLAKDAQTRALRHLESRVLGEYARSLLIRNPLRHIQSNPALREALAKTRARIFESP